MGGPKRIRCRATIHLPGVASGNIVLVDPEKLYIQECLEQGYLVRVDPVRATPKPEEAPRAPRKRKA